MLLACALCGSSCGVVTAKQVVSSEARFAVAKGAAPVPGGKDVVALTQGNKIGYRILELPCTDEHGKRTTTSLAVWYPTDDPERPFQYHFDKNAVKTQVAENGRVAPGKFPLVIHSHGATGSGLNSFFITETMARHGFDYMIDAGLGHGPHDFDGIQLRVIAKGDLPEDLWNAPDLVLEDALSRRQSSAAYKDLETQIGQCGIVRFAEASTSVPFVGAAAGALVIAQAIRLASLNATARFLQMQMGAPDMVSVAEFVPTPRINLGSVELRL